MLNQKRSKLIRDVDEKVWKRFVAYCILNDIKVGNQLNAVLEKFLNGKI